MAFCNAVTALFCLLSFTNANPPSQQDYGLCSQVFLMHQYCTSQTNPTSTGITHMPAVQPRIGKAGPRGPRGLPGIVNYTAIEEKIAAKLTAEFEEKFESLERIITAKLLKGDQDIQKIRNDTARNSKNIEETRKDMGLSAPVTSSCNDAARENLKAWDGKGGVALISRKGKLFQVYCDITSDGGGWTVLQRRFDGSVDFLRTWEEYANGFGNESGEFWLGLENVYHLIQDGSYELRVELRNQRGQTAYANYGTFSIGGRSSYYKLLVAGYSGTAGDSMSYNSGSPFSSVDRDLDAYTGGSCAKERDSAWWYNHCTHSHLNGVYSRSPFHWRDWNRDLKASEMKFRKK